MTNIPLLQTALKTRKEMVPQDLERKAKTVLKRVVSRASVYLKKGSQRPLGVDIGPSTFQHEHGSKLMGEERGNVDIEEGRLEKKNLRTLNLIAITHKSY